jgi:NAD+ kinase
MIKRIKFYSNNSEISNNLLKIASQDFLDNGFEIVEEDYDLAVAIGGDGSFLRTLKENSFNSDIYYVGINTGTLGFLQEIKPNEILNFIDRLKTEKYEIEKLAIQETTDVTKETIDKFYSLNEISVRQQCLDTISLEVRINNDVLEKFFKSDKQEERDKLAKKILSERERLQYKRTNDVFKE